MKDKTKKCFRCKNVYPIDNFYINRAKKDGLDHLCKTCSKIRLKLNYLRNRINIIKGRKKYIKNNKGKVRISLKSYYLKYKDKINKYSFNYHQENKEKINKQTEARRKKAYLNPITRLRYQACGYLGQMVFQGKIKRKPCEVCGEKKSQGHHYKGYEKEHWLDVQWLCVKHHKEVHSELHRNIA